MGSEVHASHLFVDVLKVLNFGHEQEQVVLFQLPPLFWQAVFLALSHVGLVQVIS